MPLSNPRPQQHHLDKDVMTINAVPTVYHPPTPPTRSILRILVCAVVLAAALISPRSSRLRTHRQTSLTTGRFTPPQTRSCRQ